MELKDLGTLDTESYFTEGESLPVVEAIPAPAHSNVKRAPTRRAIPDELPPELNPALKLSHVLWGSQTVKLLNYNEQYEYWLVEVEDGSWNIVHAPDLKIPRVQS